ncbi:carbon-nitrogen hydrolase family protein [Vibrio vulnificus]
MNAAITISLAQIPVVRGDLPSNLAQHIYMIERSAKHDADVVVFPELSLTGYELELANELALLPEAESIQSLSQASVEHHVIVIAGCPLRHDDAAKPTISAVICFPDGRVELYDKQYLHEGEAQFCSSGSSDYVFNVKEQQIALAICADFTHAEHAQRAKALGADLYLVSALISKNGYETDAKILSDIASEHAFPVLLSNHISPTGGWVTCGKSSIWNAQGKRLTEADSKEAGLILCTISGGDITVRNA